MPNIDRCEKENDESLANPKIQKADTCYPAPIRSINQLESSNFVDYSSVVDSSYSDVSCYENSRRERGNGPGLLKSSRGRVPVLPSRFSDSVLDTWKKEKSDELSFDDMKNERFSKKRLPSDGSYNGGQFVKKQCFENKLSLPMPDNNEGELLDSQLYLSSSTCVTSLLESDGYPATLIANGNKSTGRDKLAKEKVEKKEDYYRPEDFVQGDLVWAKCSKKSAAWPAIVIDPLWQAPEGVLKACVPKTICVMFYGYSKKGKRVITPSHPLLLLLLLLCFPPPPPPFLYSL